MGLSGVAFRQVPNLSGAFNDSQSSKPSLSAFSIPAGDRFSGGKAQIGLRCSRVSGAFGYSNSAFSDDGHLDFYRSKPRCGGGKKEKGLGAMKTKKKLKLLKGLLSEDLSMLSGIGSGFGGETQIGLIDEAQGKLISEAAEVLIKQLQRVRAEEKEMKRKKKMEKAKLKASSSSSSSSSSESETDMSSLRREVLKKPSTLLISPSTQEGNAPERNHSALLPQRNDSSTRSAIEVCTGGKCKKSGAGALLEEFERVLGNENAVVGCKCMGKCRDGPNVRIRNFVDEAQTEMIDDSMRNPSNSLCTKVSMEDVSLIVAKFLGQVSPC